MILVVGLSSAWQRTLFFEHFQPGEVNRATRVIEYASGKGVNVARVATLLGAPASVLTLAGGHRGTLFRKALAADGVKAKIIPIAGETRLCQTVIADDHITEMVEESPSLDPVEVSAVVASYSSLLTRATMVVLSGTVPHGCGDNFFAQLATLAKKRNVPVIADTQRAQLLQVVQTRPLLIKINQAELAAATGVSDVADGARILMKKGAQQVVISHGAKAAMAFDGTACWQEKPPRVKAINPIGSGDAMLAGLAVGLSKGSDLKTALTLGLACGTANALTEVSGVIRMSDVTTLLG